MNLKVISDAIPDHIAKLKMKDVNWRRLRDSLCILIRPEVSPCAVLRIREMYPLRVESMYKPCN